MIEFWVYGIPAPQGSKTRGRTKDGREYMREANPAIQSWRQTVAVTAWAAWRSQGLHTVGHEIELDLLFLMPRKKKHKDRVCVRLDAAVRPDLDKLIRAVKDALKSGGVYCDDGQVTDIHARKRIADPDQQPGVRIRISRAIDTENHG